MQNDAVCDQRLRDITEKSGELVSQEQYQRILDRYIWSTGFCTKADVLEIACGTGQGVSLLRPTANSLTLLDASAGNVADLKAEFGEEVQVHHGSAEQLPYAERSFDAVLMLECLYFFDDPAKALAEARRVLKPEGVLLVAVNNKDIYDFTPHPMGRIYFGVPDLHTMLQRAGFTSRVFGNCPIKTGTGSGITRAIKYAVTSLGIFPQNPKIKRLLKRLFLGRLIAMPHRLPAGEYAPPRIEELPSSRINTDYKILFAECRLANGASS
jgi:ubiquinone/menaquinone biosynthesis C-methylase UbiE